MSDIQEEVIEAVATSYYENIHLPALKTFSVKDYMNAKVCFIFIT